MTTHFWNIGPTDLIICQSGLALFALRPANLPRSGWQTMGERIKSWCAPRYKIVEMRMASGGDSITLSITGNANPDAVMQELKDHLEGSLTVAA